MTITVNLDIKDWVDTIENCDDPDKLKQIVQQTSECANQIRDLNSKIYSKIEKLRSQFKPFKGDGYVVSGNGDVVFSKMSFADNFGNKYLTETVAKQVAKHQLEVNKLRQLSLSFEKFTYFYNPKELKGRTYYLCENKRGEVVVRYSESQRVLGGVYFRTEELAYRAAELLNKGLADAFELGKGTEDGLY